MSKEHEELREKIQEALGKLTKQIVDWERKDLPDFNRSVEIFSELQITLLEILSIIAERCWLKNEERELKIDSLIELLAGHDLMTRKQFKDAFRGFERLLEDWLRKETGWRPVKEIKKEE